MNRSIRMVALALGVAFAALLANLHWIQVSQSKKLVDNEHNRRLLVKEYSIERGHIIVGDESVAESIPTKDNLKFLRRYEDVRLYGHITGYYSIIYGRAGLERTFNDFLAGKRPETARDWIDDLLGRERKGNSLVLTIDEKLQRIARQRLGRQRGAVAAVDPKTGAVLALYSFPNNFDPNRLSSHELDEVRGAWERYNKDRRKPLTFRATQERYPPGSTFKMVTTAAAFELGKMSPSTTFPYDRRLDLPDSDRTLGNFGGSTCGGSIRQAFLASCNTAFARVGMRLGAKKLYDMASRFGLNDPMDFDIALSASCVSALPGAGCGGPPPSRPHTAYSAIGQFNVRWTVLQAAMVAGTIASGGTVPRPYLVKEVQDEAGRTVWEHRVKHSRRIYSDRTADWLKDLMIDNVRTGTGTPAAVSGVTMGGKTGTAQTGVPGESPHVWFAAFGPDVAVAVVVENGGTLQSEATGGRVAGPIAAALIREMARRK